jgi:ATP-dependent RNA helicase SUPV3L1/SUV3
MTSLLGTAGEDFASILNSLGYRVRRTPKVAPPALAAPSPDLRRCRSTNALPQPTPSKAKRRWTPAIEARKRLSATADTARRRTCGGPQAPETATRSIDAAPEAEKTGRAGIRRNLVPGRPSPRQSAPRTVKRPALPAPGRMRRRGEPPTVHGCCCCPCPERRTSAAQVPPPRPRAPRCPDGGKPVAVRASRAAAAIAARPGRAVSATKGKPQFGKRGGKPSGKRFDKPRDDWKRASATRGSQARGRSTRTRPGRRSPRCGTPSPSSGGRPGSAPATLRSFHLPASRR